MSQANGRYSKSLPWLPNEFMTVDGMPLIYAFEEDGRMFVRLPGGRSATVEALRKAGLTVKMPVQLRRVHYA